MALTEALGTYQTAVADERAFLEEATENDAVTGVDEDSTNEAITTAINDAVDAAADQVDVELNGFNSYDFSEASDAVRAEIVTEYRAELEGDLADAKETVEETTGLLSKANTMVSATDAYEAAAAAAVEAQADLTAEAAKFNELNAGVSATASNGSDFLPATDGATANATDYSTYAVTATGVTGNIIEVDGAKLVITEAGEDLEGIDALLAAAQEEYQALRTEANAQTSLETSIQSVLAAENPDAVTGEAATVTVDTAADGVYEVTFGGTTYSYTADNTGAGDTAGDIASALATSIGSTASVTGAVITLDGIAQDDVTLGGANSGNMTLADASFDANDYYVELNQASTLDADGNFDAAVLDSGSLSAADSEAYFAAQNDLNDFNEAVQDFQAIEAVQVDAETKAQAVADAEEAVEGFDVELNDTGTGTEANDLFVYAEEAMTISGFGLQGEDQLYIGGDFTEVRAEDDVTDTRLGDSAELEVFFQQEGNNAAIYVENEAFAGNAENASDLTKITLTGVSIDDLSFEDGFVTVA